MLAGRVAIVTGGLRGIGKAVTQAFADNGAAVIAASRSSPQKALPSGVSWHECDVSKRDDVERLIADTLDRHGRLDILVNNAGVQIEKTLAETSDQDWKLLTGANMKGVFLCCRAVLTPMKSQGGGVIVNIGSISARTADPALALYNASKAFVHGLTRSIAVDHGAEGIRCNAIAPGWIMTEMAEQSFALADDPVAAKAHALGRHPVRRLGRPEDIAALALWLASDEASFATGQVFTLDGGLTAQSPLDPASL